MRSSARSSAATSADRDVNGIGAARALSPLDCSGLITWAQLEPSAHAPWTRTTLAVVSEPLVGPAWPASAQRPHPAGDGSSDLVRRIFLDVMAPRDLHLGQRWQSADEGEILVVGEDRTGLGPEEQLGHAAC